MTAPSMAMAPTVGIVSGTGPAGKGVAARLADAGYTVVLGSRGIERAQEAVRELCASWGLRRIDTLRAGTNERAASCDVVILGSSAEHTIAAARTHAEALSFKPVLSMSAAMQKGQRGMNAAMSVQYSSIAQALQAELPDSLVSASLHHVAAGTLCDPLASVDADLFVCGDTDEAIDAVSPLLDAISDGNVIDAGNLENAVALEAMTAVLVTANIKSKAHSSLRLIDTREVAVA